MTETDQVTILALRKPEEGLRKTAKTHKRINMKDENENLQKRLYVQAKRKGLR